MMLMQAALYCLLSLGLFLILHAAEVLWPRGEMPDLLERRRAFLFMMVYTPMPFLVGWAYGNLVPHGARLIDINAVVGIVATSILSVFVVDFFYYWLHRAQHRFAFLWRYHATHHSIEKMGVPTGYVHVTEPLFRQLAVGVPLTFLISPAMAIGVYYFLLLHSYYLHSATSLNFGKFAWILTDNRVHRIHHSIDPKHHHCNYGISTLVWDRLFGTAYFPTKDEWPQVGLVDIPEPKTVREYLVHPWINYKPLG